MYIYYMHTHAYTYIHTYIQLSSHRFAVREMRQSLRMFQFSIPFSTVVSRIGPALYGEDDGTVQATFQVVYMIGWAPHESQPQPKRRGSGKVWRLSCLEYHACFVFIPVTFLAIIIRKLQVSDRKYPALCWIRLFPRGKIPENVHLKINGQYLS